MFVLGASILVLVSVGLCSVLISCIITLILLCLPLNGTLAKYSGEGCIKEVDIFYAICNNTIFLHLGIYFIVFTC
jgi:hypothetical protein